jgi:hypothetical protein
MTYLRNCALVAPIIIVRFLLNNHPFLVEAIGATILVYSLPSTFEARGLLPPTVVLCIPPFVQFVKRE